MKKRTTAVAAVILATTMAFTGCQQTGKKDYDISCATILSKNEVDISSIELPKDYQTMTVTLTDDYKATDADVRSMIEQMLESYPYYVTTNKQKVEKGDLVNVSYTGYIDGKESEDYSTDSDHMTMGEDSFMEGFDAGIIGHKVGDEVTLNLTVPESDEDENSGKKVKIVVKILSIDEAKELTYDTMTDDYIAQNFKDNYNAETVEEFKTEIKKSLQEQKDSSKEEEMQDAILEKLSDDIEVEVPDDYYKSELKDYKNQLKSYAKDYNVTYKELLEAYGTTEKEIKKQVKEGVKQSMILLAIAKDMNIGIVTEDYNEDVKDYMEDSGYSNKTGFFEATGGEDQFKIWYIEMKALDELKKTAKTKVEATTEEAAETSTQDASVTIDQ